MKDHVTDFLDLYFDGEAGDSMGREINAHLLMCEDCSRLAAKKMNLRTLLQNHPARTSTRTDQQFIKEVVTRINTRPEQSSSSEAAPTGLGWLVIPLLLVAGMAFIQTVWVESHLVEFVPAVGAALNPEQMMLPFSFAFPATLAQLLNYLPGFNLWSWQWPSTVFLSAGFSILYVSWLAGWWVRNQKHVNA